MFHIDATFEGNRLIADSNDGQNWAVQTHCILNNKVGSVIQMNHRQLTHVLAFNLHPDGEPEGHEQMRAEVEPLYAGEEIDTIPLP
jgi:sorbitol-specific phosphotransferase system component IIA